MSTLYYNWKLLIEKKDDLLDTIRLNSHEINFKYPSTSKIAMFWIIYNLKRYITL